MGEWKVIFIIIVLFVMLAIGATAVIVTARSYAAELCEAPEATGWQPPDLSLCPEGMELWDCVRNASYRRDI